MKTNFRYEVIRKVIGVIPFCFFTFLPLPAQTYTLEQLKDSAVQNNIAIRSGRHQIEAARLQRKEAFTKYFPNVSGIGAWFNANKGMAKMEIEPSGMVPEGLMSALAQSFPAEALAALASPVSLSMMKTGTVAGITAVQPVYTGGQIVNGNRLARVGEDVSRLQLSLTRNEVEKQTEQYYWQLVSLEEKTRTVAAVDTLLSDIAKDVSTAVKAGVALPNDLLQVQLRQNEVESQRLKLQNGIGLVRTLLAQFCGLSDSQFTLHRSLAEAPLDSTGHDCELGMMDSSLELLPEYQLLNKQVEAARLQKKMALGGQLPTVAVGAGYNYHTLMGNDRSFGMVFATVNVPISDWWGGSHAVRRKKIAQQQAEEQLNDGSEQLMIRIQKTRNDVAEARQQLNIAHRSVGQSAENLRLNRDFYRAGTSTMSDLLEAQMLYQKALDGRVEAYADYRNKLLAYRQATGR